MIRHREIGATPPQVPVGKGETLKGLGRCHLVKQVTIDINERRAVFAPPRGARPKVCRIAFSP